MHARLTLVRASEDGIARWRSTVQEQISPNAAEKPGFVQGLWLQGEEGRDHVGIAMTVWADRAARDRAEAHAAVNRARLAEVSGGTVEVWNFELVAHSAGTGDRRP